MQLRLPVLAISLLPAVALGQSIPILNHSFEADVAPPNFWTIRVPQGWILYDPAAIIDQGRDAVGCLNPSVGTNYPAGAPHQTQVALIYLEGDRGAGPVGLRQNLPAALSPLTQYTLRVSVGNIASGIAAPPFNFLFDLDGFPGYAVQLLAGGVVVAEDFNTLFGQIPEGEFRETTVTLNVGVTHPRLGQQLSVRLVNLNIPGTPEEPGIEVNFDNVRLDSAPICPGDFDGSGGVDGDDVIEFFAAWDASDIAADVNGDSGVDGDDVIYFFARWDAGC